LLRVLHQQAHTTSNDHVTHYFLQQTIKGNYCNQYRSKIYSLYIKIFRIIA
jgi:hypothetical protein